MIPVPPQTLLHYTDWIYHDVVIILCDMSYRNPLYYSPIYIPITYSRRYGRAFDNSGWRGVVYLTYASSLDDTYDYPYYESIEFNGPGYLGYLFYMIYDMNVMYQVYSRISEKLGTGRLEKVRNRLRSRIPYIRRAFQEFFTGFEIEFMKEYGWNLRNFLSRIISLNFEKEVRDDYYVKEFEVFNRVLMDNRLKYNFTQEMFHKIYRRLIRFGIGISLSHRLRLLEYTSFFYYARDVLNGYEYDDLVDGYELFHTLSERYGLNYLVDKGLYPHRYSIIVWRGRLELSSTNTSDIMFIGDSCIFPLLANRIPSMYRSVYSVGDIRDTLMPICRICRSLLSSFIVSRGYRVDISDHRVRNGQCRIIYTIYREDIKRYESEAS